MTSTEGPSMTANNPLTISEFIYLTQDLTPSTLHPLQPTPASAITAWKN